MQTIGGRNTIARAATNFMRRLAGCDYGYAAVLAAAMLHLPAIRLAVRADVNDSAIDRRPPFCSQACAMADRLGGGVDPVPHLADRLTEPADLAPQPVLLLSVHAGALRDGSWPATGRANLSGVSHLRHSGEGQSL